MLNKLKLHELDQALPEAARNESPRAVGRLIPKPFRDLNCWGAVYETHAAKGKKKRQSSDTQRPQCPLPKQTLRPNRLCQSLTPKP